MNLLALAFAGALGAVSRYGVSTLALRYLPAGFPFGTLLVNLIGCFALGFVAELATHDPAVSDRIRAIVGTGFLGAFTTFSTFGVETFRAIETGHLGVAAANVSINVVGGLILVALGMAAARAL